MADKKKKKGQGGGSGAKMLLLLVLVAGLAGGGYVHMQEDGFKVSKSTTIKADADDVWEDWVGNFEKWPEWDAWSKADSSMTWSQQDSTPEVGSTMKWKGKDGEGQLTWISINDDDDENITAEYEMKFTDMPTAKGSFSFKEDDGVTTVTWTMSGSKGGFMGKAFFVAMSPEDEIGKSFSDGLANMKGKAEAE